MLKFEGFKFYKKQELNNKILELDHVNSFKPVFDLGFSLNPNYLNLMMFDLSLSSFILNEFKFEHLNVQFDLTHLYSQLRICVMFKKKKKNLGNNQSFVFIFIFGVWIETYEISSFFFFLILLTVFFLLDIVVLGRIKKKVNFGKLQDLLSYGVYG